MDLMILNSFDAGYHLNYDSYERPAMTYFWHKSVMGFSKSETCLASQLAIGKLVNPAACSSSTKTSREESHLTDKPSPTSTTNLATDEKRPSPNAEPTSQSDRNMSLLINNGSRDNLKLSNSVSFSSQLDPKSGVAKDFADCTRKLDQLIDIGNSKSPWDILCKLINCKVAFKKQFNGKKYTWVQLAGHPGRFKPGDREGYILKLMDELERKSFEMLKQDILGPFVPSIDRVLFDMNDGNYYTEMQDLLYSFINPSIMDIKIGVRTFIIDESDEKETMPRHDLYMKMNKIAPEELTEEEHQRQAINKRRYMSWRECSTCSSTLGFRIEAIKKNQVSEKEFYNIKEKKDVQAHIRSYTNNKKYILHMYKNRLLRLRETLLQSDFFYSHEMIGSSLLFVHDERKANIWMIDFGKTRPLPDGVKLSHDVKWEEGNYEDGYLIGIDSLIEIFNDTLNS